LVDAEPRPEPVDVALHLHAAVLVRHGEHGEDLLGEAVQL
jgi:hypothetical protein